MGISKKFFAWLLSKASYYREPPKIKKAKAQMFEKLHGTVVEIGAGAGINLPYFPKNIEYIALEPNPEMDKYLRPEITKHGLTNSKIINGLAEQILLPDASADFVVSTLVFCSVQDATKALREIRRILKPDGKFLFIEHVAAPEGGLFRKIQHALTPLWKIIGDGCDPAREIWKSIEASGLRNIEIEHFYIPQRSLAAPHIMGSATK